MRTILQFFIQLDLYRTRIEWYVNWHIHQVGYNHYIDSFTFHLHNDCDKLVFAYTQCYPGDPPWTQQAR